MFRFYLAIDYASSRDHALLNHLLNLAYKYCNLMIVYDVPDMNMFVCECATVLVVSDIIPKMTNAISKPLSLISIIEYLYTIQMYDYQPIRGYYQFGSVMKTWMHVGPSNYDELIYYSSLIDPHIVERNSDEELSSSGDDMEMKNELYTKHY